MVGRYHKETSRQLLQLLLQLVADLRQTLTLDVLQFQFLRRERENFTLNKKIHLCWRFFFLHFLLLLFFGGSHAKLDGVSTN